MELSVEKIINDVTRVVDGLTGELDGYDLTPEQFDWLLIQAAAVEGLKKENKQLYEAVESALNAGIMSDSATQKCLDVLGEEW